MTRTGQRRVPGPVPDISIETLRNLGPTSRAWLGEIGITNEADLREIGAVAAFVRLRFVLGRKVSLNMLYAMHAALEGIDWRHLTPETKAALREQLPPEMAATTRNLKG